jgi:hypothetical protein
MLEKVAYSLKVTATEVAVAQEVDVFVEVAVEVAVVVVELEPPGPDLISSSSTAKYGELTCEGRADSASLQQIRGIEDIR